MNKCKLLSLRAIEHEEITGEAPSSQLTRTEGMKAGLGIPVLSAGVHTQETRSYQLSSLGMLKNIWETLEKYPSFDKNIYDTINKPQIVWVQGRITVSIWGNPKHSPASGSAKPTTASKSLNFRSKRTEPGIHSTPEPPSDTIFTPLSNPKPPNRSASASSKRRTSRQSGNSSSLRKIRLRNIGLPVLKCSIFT